MPQTAIPVALLLFNVGVEVGQLIFVACVLGARTVLTRWLTKLPEWTLNLPPYFIGTLAMYWVIERIGAFWS